MGIAGPATAEANWIRHFFPVKIDEKSVD